VKRTRTRTRTERTAQQPELPDVRDGLTRTERLVLVLLQKLTAERAAGRSVSALELYGRVVEEVNVSQQEFQRILSRLAGRGAPSK
jgi:hypothetical protein